MGVGIAAEQERLEKQQARRPDAGSAAKPRQQVFTHQRLDEEEQECAAENGQGVEGHGATLGVGPERSTSNVQRRTSNGTRFAFSSANHRSAVSMCGAQTSWPPVKCSSLTALKPARVRSSATLCTTAGGAMESSRPLLRKTGVARNCFCGSPGIVSTKRRTAWLQPAW